MEFEEFFGAFEGGSEPAEVTPAAEEAPSTEEDPNTEPEAGAEQEPSEPVEESAEDAEDGDQAEPSGEDGNQDQTFTVRIGEEDRQYSLEEMTELARKGAGYDDLQAQLDESNQTRDQLQAQLDEQQEVMDILNQIAEKSGKTRQELTKQLYINFRKSNGVSEDAAALELENAQLKKQMDAGKPKQDPAAGEDSNARAKREIAEFKQLHPGVELTDEQIAKLRPDIRKGMSLANAYQKMLNEQKAAQLAEAERKAAANAQNNKNRTASPGSQRDSGGRREKSGFDDFFSQFN